MPARSRRQQRYLYARFGEEWVEEHHFDKIAKKGGRRAAKGAKARRKR